MQGIGGGNCCARRTAVGSGGAKLCVGISLVIENLYPRIIMSRRSAWGGWLMVILEEIEHNESTFDAASGLSDAIKAFSP